MHLTYINIESFLKENKNELPLPVLYPKPLINKDAHGISVYPPDILTFPISPDSDFIIIKVDP